MAKREKNPVHHVQMTEGKRQIIRELLQEYEIKSAQDIQEALKDLLGGTIKEMMEAEMEDHLGYGKSERIERTEINDYRNGTKPKTVNSNYGSFTIEVLTIEVGENESSKYWLGVLNGLKNRGVKDVLILCLDGLTGLKEAVQTAFPKTEHQRCIVHMVRNTLKYVPNKDMKPFAKDLKTIYTAPDEKTALKRLEAVTNKWTPSYPMAMKRWTDNWDVISPIFMFSAEVRKAFYTTNSIESLNASFRKLNRQRSVFPSPQALLKALYLSMFEATKRWTIPIRNWGKVHGELEIMHPDRLQEA